MLKSLTIQLFNKERIIRVYLPGCYEGSTKRYPVLYMHDGQNVFGLEEAVGGESLGMHTSILRM
ncbi:alpha/beta hydrolase-fold protein [Cytobacillus sp. NCCP-133]|uniref:alpha/beta hydrolase-fold protein n=1 Tax=Cytobacillus sp. NCCP-133 TaxID=766848 RepID=UPI003FA41385